jgi:hypothetical protein
LEKINYKRLVFISLLCIYFIGAIFCADKKDTAYELSTTGIPQFHAPQFSLVVQPFGENPDKKDIYKNFNVVLIYEDKKTPNEIILTCKDGTIYDKSGNTIFALNKKGPVFYGYKIEVLPWNRRVDRPGDLILSPLFGDGTSVGDTLTFVWDKEKKAYYRFVPNIP